MACNHLQVPVDKHKQTAQTQIPSPKQKTSTREPVRGSARKAGTSGNVPIIWERKPKTKVPLTPGEWKTVLLLKKIGGGELNFGQ